MLVVALWIEYRPANLAVMSSNPPGHCAFFLRYHFIHVACP